MKTICIAILSLLTTTAFSQQYATWIGGTPGKETSWDETRNWNTNRVPDENTHVIIEKRNTGHYAQPVIEGEAIIASIRLANGAELTIQKHGELIIDGTNHYSEGITLYGGTIFNLGHINLYNLAEELTGAKLALIDNRGSVFVDNKLLNTGKDEELIESLYVERF